MPKQTFSVFQGRENLPQLLFVLGLGLPSDWEECIPLPEVL